MGLMQPVAITLREAHALQREGNKSGQWSYKVLTKLCWQPCVFCLQERGACGSFEQKHPRACPCS